MSLPTDGPYPALGLYWFCDFDPTLGLGLSAPLGQLLVRTDTNTIYYKAGLADTAWLPTGGGGAAADVNVQNQGVAIPNNPHQTIDFEGEGVVASDAGGSVARVDISGTGASLVKITNQTILNLVGSNNDVNFWGAGPRTTRVEVDIVGSPVTTITGILAGNDGDVLYLTNGGGGGGNVPDQLVLTNNDLASAALNRIWTPTGKEMRLANNEGVVLIYAGGFGWQTFGNPTSISRVMQISLEPSTTPAALANGSTTNDYNPWTGTLVNAYVRQDTGLTSTLTGINAPGPDNSEGRLVVFTNISTTGTITIKNNDVGSAAANRVLCPGSQNLRLGPQSTIVIIYDDTVAMWRVVAVASAGSASDQEFRVVRQVGDTDTITIDASRGFLPRANTNYDPHVTLGANSLSVGVVGCDPADFTLTQFKLRLTAAWAAGDSALITVRALS